MNAHGDPIAPNGGTAMPARRPSGSARALLLALVLPGLVALSTASAAVYYYRAGIPRYAAPILPSLPPGRAARTPASGPLRRHPTNPRYFADATGRAVLLTGAHTWADFADNGIGTQPPAFDYGAYLDFLVANNHDFIRLWAWENSRWGPWVTTADYRYFPGPPYRRTGPGLALDGMPRFDLDSLDDAYFERLRSRVARAGERGIYVSIMLFNGWSIDNAHSRLYRGNPWQGHPFNRANNVNGVDGDPDRNDGGEETHQLRIPKVTAYQEAYVRRVIDAVNDLDNVLFEISNESYASSRDWQYHMIDLIHAYERTKPKQHPVGMSQYQWPGSNADLLNGPADWISPWEELPRYPYRNDPPVADGRKVVIVDTDHLWGIGGDYAWAWKTFLRGNQPSFMDGYDGEAVGSGAPAPWDVRLASWKDIVDDVLRRSRRPVGWEPNAERWVRLRANLGYILDFSRRVDLARMTPRPELASTRYCLAYASATAAEYLVYVPDATKPVDVNLSGFRGPLATEWFDPRTGTSLRGDPVRGGAARRFVPPFHGDAVLYLRGGRAATGAPIALAPGATRPKPRRRPRRAGAGRRRP
ncbi:MAG TPA: DUF6298 domain-containing protein [Longimicrobiales bacterium]|nr:DUF6298 domain-containing protein [Longimicrobiales bacterium]